LLVPTIITKCSRNSHYETDFGISSAKGAGNTKISFLKACRRQAFKKLISIIRIAENNPYKAESKALLGNAFDSAL
jgi:hypothetical protein